MSPSTWRRVKQLHAEACDLPEEERISFVQARMETDPSAATETLRLLQSNSLPVATITPIRLPSLTPGPGYRLRPGQVLADRFLVRRFVAAGGFGEVYEAEDRERAEIVALKIFRSEFSSAEHVTWLRREVQMAQKVRHANVCRVFELISAEGMIFLTMEFLAGETLTELLAREGALPERRALPLVRQIVAGLAAAHMKGVVHRDLKPSNVMIVPRPNGPVRIVITDFGMARVSDDNRRTTMTMQTSAALGTPAYMSPEQVTGKAVGKAADIYALGVVLHEMLTGELPFSDESPLAMAVRKTREAPESPRRFAPAIHRNWEQAIMRCLQPQPRQRMQDVRHVLELLETRSRTKSRLQIAWRGASNVIRKLSWKVAAAAALLVLVLVGWMLVNRAPDGQTQLAWEQGLMNWHAGEPLAAIQQWDKIPQDAALPYRASVDLALAWNKLGFRGRAQQELGRFPRWQATAIDRLYAEATAAILNSDRATALQLLQERRGLAPNDALVLADLALQGKPELWKKVTELRPDHAGAHLQLAEASVAGGQGPEADRQYVLADTYFHAAQQTEMLRISAGRRGLRLLANGDFEQAKMQLLPGAVGTIKGNAPCEHFVVLTQGRKDNFAGDADPTPTMSPRLQAMVLANPNAKMKFFDDPKEDSSLAASFPLPAFRFCSATLEVHMRRVDKVGGSENDALNYGVAPFDILNVPGQTYNLWAAYSPDAKRQFSIDLEPEFLAAVQRAYAKDPVAYLDLRVGEDTEIDYLQLTLVY